MHSIIIQETIFFGPDEDHKWVGMDLLLQSLLLWSGYPQSRGSPSSVGYQLQWSKGVNILLSSSYSRDSCLTHSVFENYHPKGNGFEIEKWTVNCKLKKIGEFGRSQIFFIEKNCGNISQNGRNMQIKISPYGLPAPIIMLLFIALDWMRR